MSEPLPAPAGFHAPRAPPSRWRATAATAAPTALPKHGEAARPRDPARRRRHPAKDISSNRWFPVRPGRLGGHRGPADFSMIIRKAEGSWRPAFLVGFDHL